MKAYGVIREFVDGETRIYWSSNNRHDNVYNRIRRAAKRRARREAKEYCKNYNDK